MCNFFSISNRAFLQNNKLAETETIPEKWLTEYIQRYKSTTTTIECVGGNGINVLVWKNRYKSILQYPRPSHSSTANTCKRNEQQTARAYSCAQYLFTVTMAGTVDTQTISLSSWYYNYFYFHAIYLVKTVVVGFGIPGTRPEKQQQRSCNSDSLRPRGQVDAERASARFLYGNYLIIHILAYQPEAAVCLMETQNVGHPERSRLGFFIIDLLWCNFWWLRKF